MVKLFVLLLLVSCCPKECPKDKRIYKEVNYSVPIPDTGGWLLFYKDGSTGIRLIPLFNGDLHEVGCLE